MPAMKSEKINEVMTEVNNLKDKQVDLDSKLDTMRLENEALWKEVRGSCAGLETSTGSGISSETMFC